MSRAQTILGPLLLPRDDGRIEFIHDGALACDERGTITYVGPAKRLPPSLASSRQTPRKSDGLLLPPLLDAHIHIPQHPIRGHFMDGVGEHPEEGRLIAGLNRNVFPAEAKCADESITRRVVADFLSDTLAKGVAGGAAYMTVHASAARIALEMLPDSWQVGLVLMNQNCPEYLRTNESSLGHDVESLAKDFGRRLIVTDRFAVAVDSALRRRGVALAKRLGLRMQTHLNEQLREKRFVEQTLYPDAGAYTDVYDRDGLLDCEPILAHCIWMSMGEFQCVSWRPGASIAHCPTSNTLLGSGVMPLDRLYENGIDYAICTDVGASPTTSILAEMAQFLKVHRGRSDRATPQEALYRTTLGAAKILRLDDQLGRLRVGAPMSFIEVRCDPLPRDATADDAILRGLLDTTAADLDDFANRPACRQALDLLTQRGLDIGADLDCLSDEIDYTVRRLDDQVVRVTVAGEVVWQRG